MGMLDARGERMAGDLARARCPASIFAFSRVGAHTEALSRAEKAWLPVSSMGSAMPIASSKPSAALAGP